MVVVTKRSVLRFLIASMYLVADASQADASVELDEVNVVAKAISDTKPVKGYNAKQSRTATKTDTALKDTPQSISVVTQDVIKDQSIQSISEAVRYVPGVTASQGEGNRDAINFRGAGVTTGDFYVDGVRDDAQIYRDLYNTDRIEILRGSNAMIFGRGGSGGVINRVSKEAGWDPVRELSVTYGAYDQKRTAIDIGNSINDVAAFRLNAVYEDANSYRDGVSLERYGVTPTLTIKPSDNTKIVLSAEYFKDKRIGDRGMPSIGSGLRNRPYDIGDHSTFFGNARLSPNESETKALNATIEHAFENGVSVRNITRYADYDKYYQNVFVSNPENNRTVIGNNVFLSAYLDNTQRQNFINQTDITYNLKVAGLEHRLMGGMEHGRQYTENSRLTSGSSETINSVSVFDPVSSQILSFNNATRNRRSDANITAFYLQDQIVINSKWDLLLGIRHDKFAIDYTDLPIASSPNRFAKINTTDNKVSPRAGLIYKPTERLSLYASYSQSFVPRAGDQLTDLTTVNANFSPEKFINHEIGTKYEVTPDLSLTVAVYKLQRENMVVTSPIGNGQTIILDGQETKGLELGVSGKVTSKWSMFGGYALQDAKITEDYNSGSYRISSGAEALQTPRQTFSLWNRYQFSEVWGAALGVISRSEMYAAIPTATTSTVLSGYTRLDAAIYGQFTKNLRLQINLENLMNKEYALSAHNNNNIVPGSPFAGRATLIYNF